MLQSFHSFPLSEPTLDGNTILAKKHHDGNACFVFHMFFSIWLVHLKIDQKHRCTRLHPCSKFFSHMFFLHVIKSYPPFPLFWESRKFLKCRIASGWRISCRFLFWRSRFSIRFYLAFQEWCLEYVRGFPWRWSWLTSCISSKKRVHIPPESCCFFVEDMLHRSPGRGNAPPAWHSDKFGHRMGRLPS